MQYKIAATSLREGRLLSMPPLFAFLLWPLALAACSHPATPPLAPAPAGKAPAGLAITLRALPDTAIEYRLERLARDVEQLFARGGERADVSVVGQAALRVVLPNGMRKIPWPAFRALEGLAPPTDKPEWSAEFQLPVAAAWLAAAREHIIDETVVRVRDRLVRVLHYSNSRVRRERDRVIVEVDGLPMSAREPLLQTLTARPRLTFYLIDDDAPWMRAHAEKLARGGLTLASSPNEQYWRSSEEAPLRLFVGSLRGADAVPSDHRLIVGDEWVGNDHFFRTFFVRSRVELNSEELTEVHLRKAVASERIAAVGFSLTRWGKQRFADLTARNVGARLAVVLEPVTLRGFNFGATVLSAAIIDGPITDGHVNIRFPNTDPSAQERLAIDMLGVLLECGNLPADLVEMP